MIYDNTQRIAVTEETLVYHSVLMIEVVEMNDDQLQAISPIDGRYLEKSTHLRQYFSESALMRYRVLTEIKWLIFLSEYKGVNDNNQWSHWFSQKLPSNLQASFGAQNYIATDSTVD